MLSLSGAIRIRLANAILPSGFCITKEEKQEQKFFLIMLKGVDYNVHCTNSKKASSSSGKQLSPYVADGTSKVQ